MPYPEFQTVLRRGDNSGSITNEEVFFSWRHTYSHGLSVMANHLIAKQMWARDKKNPQDTQFERRIGSEDRPQQFTLTASYELPFGKGKPVAASAGPVLDRLIGGWQVSSIYTAARGQALTWGAVVFTGKNWRDIVNVPGGQTINQWLNPAAFDRNPNDQPNASYQFIYMPKAVPGARGTGHQYLGHVTEQANPVREKTWCCRCALDAFDTLNHPNWGAPNVSPTSSAFGRITSQANLPRTLQLGARLAF